MAYRFLLLCAGNAGHGLVEIVDTQRSSCSRYALTDSSFSLSDFASRRCGVEVDAEHDFTSNHRTYQNFDSARLTARRWIPRPGCGSSRCSRQRATENESVGLTSSKSVSCACAAAVSFLPSTVYKQSLRVARSGRHAERRAVDVEESTMRSDFAICW